MTCKVKPAGSSARERVSWRLSRKGRTVAHGTDRTRNGRASPRFSKLAELRDGRYVLRVARRRAATFVLR